MSAWVLARSGRAPSCTLLEVGRLLVIPQNADEIEPDWLEAALSTRYPGVRVASVEWLHRAEVTNAHARMEVAYDESVGAPEHLFVKLLPSEPRHRQAILQTQMGLREARFYESLASAMDFRVPTIHFVAHDARDGQFILLMEDLETSGCSVSDGTQSVSRDAAARALQDAAALATAGIWPVRRAAR